MIKGFDCSHWQDDNSTPQRMDFSKAKKAGAEYVFIKASERMSIDGDYVYNWDNAKKAGLLRGAYHFMRWDVSGVQQARFFCNNALKGDFGELPLVADFEAGAATYGGRTYWPSNNNLFAFLQEVETISGKVPMIYTSPGYWQTNGKKKGTQVYDTKWAYYPLWIAHYTKAERPIVPKPWDDFLFWQHGVYPVGLEYGAESKGLDLNWYNGSMIELMALAGQGELEPPIPDPEPIPTNIAIQVASNKNEIENIKDWAKNLGMK